MDKLLTSVGGVLGGYALLKLPMAGTFLSGIEPVVDGVGMLSVILFAGALIYYGVRSIINK